MRKIIEEELSKTIIGAAIEVHRYWGPGLLESIYRKSMVYELKILGVVVQEEVPVNLMYKGVGVSENMRIDLLVGERIILELKSVSELAPIHEAQLLTYLRITACRVGLLINFNTLKLMDGFKRFVL